MMKILEKIFGKKKVKKQSILMALMDCPDNFEYNLKVENDEIIITIRKKGAE